MRNPRRRGSSNCFSATGLPRLAMRKFPLARPRTRRPMPRMADAKAASDAVGPAPPPPGSEVAALAPDEVCKRDEDRLARLCSKPSIDEVARLADELGCQKLWPQVLSLTKSLVTRFPRPLRRRFRTTPLETRRE
jgi:hypothetical protein